MKSALVEKTGVRHTRRALVENTKQEESSKWVKP